MIHLRNQNIFCQYDLEIIKNVILKCDQCHLSQYVEDFVPYYKVILIEVELSQIPEMINTMDQNKNFFKTMCGEEIHLMSIIPIPQPLPIEAVTITADTTRTTNPNTALPTINNVLPDDFDEKFCNKF